MNPEFLSTLYQANRKADYIPSPDKVCHVIQSLLQLLFPELAEKRYKSLRELTIQFDHFKLSLFELLDAMAERLNNSPENIEEQFIEQLPLLRNSLLDDATTITEGDPAATCRSEVIRTYPGFLAIAVYRIAHEFYKLEVPLIPRILTEHAHSKTGIDIHPGAQIGANFFIDHGTGLVIGETTIIGNNVKVYQGVTLGALSVSKDMTHIKRHPTIEDRVVIYSNATILGGETIIGHDSIVGGNVWITKSVPPHTRMYHQAQVKYQQDPELPTLSKL